MRIARVSTDLHAEPYRRRWKNAAKKSGRRKIDAIPEPAMDCGGNERQDAKNAKGKMLSFRTIITVKRGLRVG